MTLLTFDLKWCAQCGGERPHSKRGKCQSCWTRRSKPLRRSLPLRSVKPKDDRWAVVKAEVFARDDNRCQRCGSGHIYLQAHHRVVRGFGGTSVDEHEYGKAGLVTACIHCHRFVHENPQESMDSGWLVTRFGDVDPASVPILTTSGWVLLGDKGSKRGVDA